MARLHAPHRYRIPVVLAIEAGGIALMVLGSDTTGLIYTGAALTVAGGVAWFFLSRRPVTPAADVVDDGSVEADGEGAAPDPDAVPDNAVVLQRRSDTVTARGGHAQAVVAAVPEALPWLAALPGAEDDAPEWLLRLPRVVLNEVVEAVARDGRPVAVIDTEGRVLRVTTPGDMVRARGVLPARVERAADALGLSRGAYATRGQYGGLSLLSFAGGCGLAWLFTETAQWDILGAVIVGGLTVGFPAISVFSVRRGYVRNGYGGAGRTDREKSQ